MAETIQALGDDESGFHRSRVRRLARHLGEGDSLVEAIEKVPGVLTVRQETQIRFGMEMGDLNGAIESLIECESEEDSRLLQYSPYILLTLLFTVSIVTFMSQKIVPTMIVILEDFELEPTPALRLWYSVVDRFSFLAYLIVPFFGAMIVFRFLNVDRILQKGIFSRPLSFLFDWDTPDFLRQLSVVARRPAKLDAALATLASCHHSPWRRKRLGRLSLEGPDSGIWRELQQQKLLSQNECDVVLASMDLKNTSWALQELAECRQEKLAKRFAILTRSIYPLVIVGLGGFVLLTALSVFSVLYNLVWSLA